MMPRILLPPRARSDPRRKVSTPRFPTTRLVWAVWILPALTACDDPTQPVAVASPVSTLAPAGALDQQFRIRFLPRSLVTPQAINEKAEVVANKGLPTGQVHAALWRAGQGVRDLGTLGGGLSQAQDINDRSEVVGLSEIRPGSFDARPFLWTEARGMRSLGTLGGAFGIAWDINNRREVVGDSETSDGAFHAFLWRPGSRMQSLGTLGGQNSSATGMNDATQIVGISQTSDGSEHAYLWTAARGMEDLGTLGGSNSQAWAISETGVVVGASETAAGTVEAFRWTRARGMRSLGTLGEPIGQALGINSHRRIVGVNITESFNILPFLWTPERGMQRLPMAGGPFGEANDLNEFGQIVGTLAPEGQGRVAIWTPTAGPLVANAPMEDEASDIATSPLEVRDLREAVCARMGRSLGWSRLGNVTSRSCSRR